MKSYTIMTCIKKLGTHMYRSMTLKTLHSAPLSIFAVLKRRLLMHSPQGTFPFVGTFFVALISIFRTEKLG